ncbi:hypothetical protein [Streptomyces sp. NPDC054854]
MLERRPREDRTEVTFVLPAAGARSFRYLAAGDYWFNDEHAETQDGPNSRLHA